MRLHLPSQGGRPDPHYQSRRSGHTRAGKWTSPGHDEEEPHLVTVRRLREVTFQDLVTAWNEGFRGYAFDMTMSLDALVSRFGWEDLSANISLVAFDGERPVGLVLSGLRTITGRRVAWSGGTGVPPDQRGVGRLLVEVSMNVLREESVSLATLEALSDNERAIGLYEAFGYRTVDRLLLMTAETLGQDAFGGDAAEARIRSTHPAAAVAVPFYEHFAPWQTQWPSARGGECLLLADADGTVEGYALLTRSWTANGDLETITLLQAKVRPDGSRPERAIRLLLARAFAPLAVSCRRVALNVPASNRMAVDALKEAGFGVLAEQVHMTADIG